MASAGRQTFLAVTNIAVSLMALVVLYTLISSYIYRRGTELQSGQPLPPATSLRLATETPTLLVAIKAGCIYCERSMPFYRQLAGMQRDGQLGAKVQVLVADEPVQAGHVLRIYGIQLPYIGGVDLTSMKIPGTPTLVLVKPDSTVVKTWIGALSPQKETEVLSAIRKDK